MVIFRKQVTGASAPSVTRFLARACRVAGLRGGVTVLITSSREIRTLNRRFRGKDKPTDVLSFPAAFGAGDNNEGDIAISADIATKNAVQLGHRPFDELKILILHGLLHLAGYDHEQDRGAMAREEHRLRRELGLPDALIERTMAVRSGDKRPAGCGNEMVAERKNNNKRQTKRGTRTANRETRNGGSK